MKNKESGTAAGFIPYIALALILLILYFAVSPFIELKSSTVVLPKRFTGSAQYTPSAVQPSLKFGENTYGASSGSLGRNGTVLNNDAAAADRIQSASEGDLTARLIMIAGIAEILAIIAILFFRHRLTPKKLGLSVLCFGFTMRVGYMLYTPYYIRGHDVCGLADAGHLGYLYSLYSTFKIPNSNIGQFYHPPLNYILEAIVARFYAFVTQSANTQTILESARLVPCFASCALLIVCWRLFDELKFDNVAKLTALSIIALHPQFFILSASINNDMLMIFFFMTAFLYTVRWYHNKSFKNTILLAISSGCAMMTKFSGGLIVIFSAIVFLTILVRGIKAKSYERYLRQLSVYLAIFFPLGMWYSIRNLLLFNQPIGYVLNIGQISNLYTGDKSFFDRFISFPPGDLFNSIYCSAYDDYRIWIYTVKCSLFGEFSFTSAHNAIAAVFIVLNVIMILLSLAAMIYMLVCRRGSNAITRWGFFSIWVLLIASFIYFNIKYPVGCSMDFRYIVPTLISGAAFIGIANSQMRRLDGRLPKALFYISSCSTAAFAVSSIIFYVI